MPIYISYESHGWNTMMVSLKATSLFVQADGEGNEDAPENVQLSSWHRG